MWIMMFNVDIAEAIERRIEANDIEYLCPDELRTWATWRRSEGTALYQLIDCEFPDSSYHGMTFGSKKRKARHAGDPVNKKIKARLEESGKRFDETFETRLTCKLPLTSADDYVPDLMPRKLKHVLIVSTDSTRDPLPEQPGGLNVHRFDSFGSERILSYVGVKGFYRLCLKSLIDASGEWTGTTLRDSDAHATVIREAFKIDVSTQQVRDMVNRKQAYMSIGLADEPELPHGSLSRHLKPTEELQPAATKDRGRQA